VDTLAFGRKYPEDKQEILSNYTFKKEKIMSDTYELKTTLLEVGRKKLKILDKIYREKITDMLDLEMFFEQIGGTFFSRELIEDLNLTPREKGGLVIAIIKDLAKAEGNDSQRLQDVKEMMGRT